MRRDLTLKGDFDGLSLSFPLPRLAPAILSRIDGRASLGEIQAALQDLESHNDWDRFSAQFGRLYAVLNGLNHLFIRYPPA